MTPARHPPATELTAATLRIYRKGVPAHTDTRSFEGKHREEKVLFPLTNGKKDEYKQTVSHRGRLDSPAMISLSRRAQIISHHERIEGMARKAKSIQSEAPASPARPSPPSPLPFRLRSKAETSLLSVPSVQETLAQRTGLPFNLVVALGVFIHDYITNEGRTVLDKPLPAQSYVDARRVHVSPV